MLLLIVWYCIPTFLKPLLLQAGSMDREVLETSLLQFPWLEQFALTMLCKLRKPDIGVTFAATEISEYLQFSLSFIELFVEAATYHGVREVFAVESTEHHAAIEVEASEGLLGL